MLSCKPKEKEALAEKESDTVVVYNETEYRENGGRLQNPPKALKIVDTACINGKKRAEKLIEKGISKYYFGVRLGFPPQNERYLREKFSEKEIDIGFYYTEPTCIPEMPGPFEANCFEKSMNIAFEKKYSKARVDSILHAKFELAP